jgi:hypothetical protein
MATTKEANSPSTNLTGVYSNKIVSSASIIASTNKMPNALTATNLEQWKEMIKGLKYSDNFGNLDSWVMEQTNQTMGIPVLLIKNSKPVSFKVRFINVFVKDGSNKVFSVDIHSPIMNIDETRSLGLELCNMFGFDSTDFSAWCDKVGNHWLDAPLYGIGGGNYSLNIRHTFDNEKPWYIDLVIANP